VILEIIEDVGPEAPERIKVIRSRLQSALRQYFYFTIGRRPVILPFVMVI
jgi:ribonuclease J